MKGMSRLCLAFVGLIMMVGLSSCRHEWKSWTDFGDKAEVTEERVLRDFEKIEISGSPRVVYTQADSFSVRVVGSVAAVDNLLSEVNGRTLLLRNRGKISIVNISFDNHDDAVVYVTSPDLTSVRISGSGDFVSTEKIDTDTLDLILRGSGDIEVNDIICDYCTMELVGSGDIDVKRMETRDVSASLVGSGDVGLNLLRVNATRLDLRGSGDMEVDFAEECGQVDCNLHGSGDIQLKGSVRQYNVHKSGSGDIDVGSLDVRK